MNNRDPQQPQGQSVFVSVVAWLFIITGGFAAFIALMQNIMLHFLLPTEKMQALIQEQHQAGPTSVVTEFLFAYMGWFFAGMLALAVLTVTAAIGLLLRKNRARQTFIGLMLAIILWNLVTLIAQQLMLQPTSPADATATDFVQQSQGMMDVVGVFSYILAAIVCGLCGWIAWRLSRPAIKREFGSSQA